MQNFVYANPTKILFGKGMIEKITEEIPNDRRVLIIYGGGSIHKNGVYDQVKNALAGYDILEFSGIEPNPHYETCLKAVDFIHNNKIDYLLAVGGGSVADATKFIAAAAKFEGKNPWDILLTRASNVTAALPFGTVITLPATGSEMNSGAVITRAATDEKRAFASPHTFPQFSVLDPETTYSLPKNQIGNGVVDAFIHVIEQYLTSGEDNAPLQDYMCEAILKVLVKEASALMKDKVDYDSRANFMWAATWALNGWVGKGVEQDWATHMIGHELTALYGLDHAQTLAIVLPGIMMFLKTQKSQKIGQLGRHIFNIHEKDNEQQIEKTIHAMEQFFHSVGVKTRLSDYGLGDEVIDLVANRIDERGWKLGEKQNITGAEIKEILQLRL